MSFFPTSFLSLNLKLKKYSKVIVAMGGKTISDIEYDKLNRLLQTNKCALLVCNAFFYKNLGLKDNANIYYCNIDPIQILFFKTIYYSKNPSIDFKNFIKQHKISKKSLTGFKQNAKSIKNFKTQFPSAKIIDFFTSVKDKNLLSSKGHYIAYPANVRLLLYKFILRFVMDYHLSGWTKSRPWKFLKNNGYFPKHSLFSYLKYIIFLASRHNSFYLMMDLAANIGTKEIIIAGRSCTISNDLKYINKVPYLNYSYYYDIKKNYMKYNGMNPDLILEYMCHLRLYMSSFESFHSVKIKTYSKDLWSIDRNFNNQ